MILRIIGPSGAESPRLFDVSTVCTKSHRGGREKDACCFDGKDIYARDVDPVIIRRRDRHGLSASKPFPTMSISAMWRPD